ncbi:hypothetical protein PENTCL1PPCAC_29132, partial [Pristionchus entomophagus]
MHIKHQLGYTATPMKTYSQCVDCVNDRSTAVLEAGVLPSRNYEPGGIDQHAGCVWQRFQPCY